jgi:hypothetical protein
LGFVPCPFAGVAGASEEFQFFINSEGLSTKSFLVLVPLWLKISLIPLSIRSPLKISPLFLLTSHSTPPILRKSELWGAALRQKFRKINNIMEI